MRWLSRVIRGAAALARPRRSEQELDEELRAYLEATVADRMRAGLGRDEAIRAARLHIGSLEAVKDRTRDAGWEMWIENLARDMRHAVRTLRRSPAFTSVALLILALGIGANAAIFSVLDAVVLRALRVERPDELIGLAAIHGGNADPAFSYAAYRRLAEEGAAVVDALAASSARRDAVTVDGPPEPFDIKLVSGNYFTALGVPAALGRTLQPSDARRPGGEPVAVLSDAYWARRFGRDPSVIGRGIRFRATAFTIVGVAPRGFSGETVGESVDAWIPVTAQPGAPEWVWSGHSATWLRILARRRPGVTLDRVRAALDPVYDRLRDEIAGEMGRPELRDSVLASRLGVVAASGGSSRLRDDLRAPLVILMAMVGLLLAVACANIATLMLARATSRRRETAVCLALGAGRLRLIRQGLLEALVLATLGAAAGLLLAWLSGPMLVGLVTGVLPISLDVTIDGRVLAYAMLLSCATALLCGALPAIRAARIDPLPAFRIGGGGERLTRSIPLVRALVVNQIAVSLLLLIAAGLFAGTLARLGDVETGFDPDGVIVFRVTPPAGDGLLSDGEVRLLYERLLARAEDVPGVEAASASSVSLFTSTTWGNAIAVEGFVPRSGVTARTFANLITPRYFEVMRIAVVGGRGFTDDDREGRQAVAVVNQTFARQFFAGADPIDRRVTLCASDPCAVGLDDARTIVGMVEDLKYVDLREESRPMLYLPFTQYSDPHLHEIEVRTTGAPAAVARTLHRELSDVDSRVGVVAMTELRDQVNASITVERLLAKVSATFGLLALALAAVGLYGVVAYATAQRTGEIGIRMALGASRRDIRWLVLRDTLGMIVAGALIGLPLAMAAARLLGGQLYGIGPHDPVVIATGLTTLVLVTLAAGCVPARRASRLDPVTAVRNE